MLIEADQVAPLHVGGAGEALVGNDDQRIAEWKVGADEEHGRLSALQLEPAGSLLDVGAVEIDRDLDEPVLVGHELIASNDERAVGLVGDLIELFYGQAVSLGELPWHPCHRYPKIIGVLGAAPAPRTVSVAWRTRLARGAGL
jgi:hypothetical protein